MPTPINIKWYETQANLDGVNVLRYSRPDISVPVVSVRMGGLVVDFEHMCEKWHTRWDKIEGRFTFHFELSDTAEIADPLNLTVPIVKFTDRWFKSRGMEFDLSRRIDNRIFQLTKFLGDKGILVPNGTLFIVTRAGIIEALANNWSWSLIIGYSAVEPQPQFQCNRMYLNTPTLRLPKNLEVVKPPEPPRVSRYERPWVI